MLSFRRHKANPILSPFSRHKWESLAAFNGCPIVAGNKTILLYRALSKQQRFHDVDIELSTIGVAVGSDGIHFDKRVQLITPEYNWEWYGCEDPRVTFFEGKYYIFYTTLSTYPFNPAGIRIGLAITTDFVMCEKHPVTPFNSKAMALFPQRVQGKIAAILTTDTDDPPSSIAIALFDRVEDMWSPRFWDRWYAKKKEWTLPLADSIMDHVEVGAPPIRTNQGYLFFYSFIKDYQTDHRIFSIKALLLDADNPVHILGKIEQSLLDPQAPYEKHGVIPNITFPSGALIHKKNIRLYYGAADTVCAVAECDLDALMQQITKNW